MVQEYHRAIERSRMLAERARSRLQEFCADGVRGLLQEVYDGTLLLGVTYPGEEMFEDPSQVICFPTIYKLSGGRAWRGSYEVGKAMDEVEIGPGDIPYSKFGFTQLLSLARSLEGYASTQSAS